MGQGPIFRNIRFSKELSLFLLLISNLTLTQAYLDSWTHTWLQMITNDYRSNPRVITLTQSNLDDYPIPTTDCKWLQVIRDDHEENYYQKITDLNPPSPPWPTLTWKLPLLTPLLRLMGERLTGALFAAPCPLTQKYFTALMCKMLGWVSSYTSFQNVAQQIYQLQGPYSLWN